MVVKECRIKKESERKMAENWKGAGENGEVWEQYKSCVLKAADQVCG